MNPSVSTDLSVSSHPDVVIVGAGNAAACAALAAREAGVNVIMLEAAPVEECGGNSRYTAGAMRVLFNGVDDLKQIVPDLTQAEIDSADFGTYTAAQFYDDMGRITQYRTDPDLCEILISRSLETLVWMREKGVKFQASFGRQAMKVGDKFKFFGGLAAETWGGGPGLVENEHQACTRAGIPIFYETPATGLIQDDAGRVIGVKARHKNKNIEIRCKAVVLACGGFESNAEMRTRYLGAGWDLAKVRGTRFNTGAGIRMALAAGALPYGHWSGCHAVGWDMNAPAFGDLAVGAIGDERAIPSLVASLAPTFTRAEAAASLAKFGSKVIPFLLPLLNDSHDENLLFHVRETLASAGWRTRRT